MINSSIASSHHYYVMFFESSELKTLDSLYNLFSQKKDREVLNSKLGIEHIQLQVKYQFGNETALRSNKIVLKDNILYWYDLYIGKLTGSKNGFFICYPYNGLTKTISDVLLNSLKSVGFYKPTLPKLLSYMKSRRSIDLTQIEKAGFDFDIIKYSAEIKDEINAKRVNILGDNPLNSKVYEILEGAKDEGIRISPVALKLRCMAPKIQRIPNSISRNGEIEISFDRLGKYRFWLKKDSQEYTLPILNYVFKFFEESETLLKSDFISTFTLLDDE